MNVAKEVLMSIKKIKNKKSIHHLSTPYMASDMCILKNLLGNNFYNYFENTDTIYTIKSGFACIILDDTNYLIGSLYLHDVTPIHNASVISIEEQSSCFSMSNGNDTMQVKFNMPNGSSIYSLQGNIYHMMINEKKVYYIIGNTHVTTEYNYFH